VCIEHSLTPPQFGEGQVNNGDNHKTVIKPSLGTESIQKKSKKTSKQNKRTVHSTGQQATTSSEIVQRKHTQMVMT
jgi:hypothetical protein